MFSRLRRKFVCIAMLSVTMVMGLVGFSINLLNFYSTDADLQSMLEIIYHNQGVLPEFSGNKKPEESPEREGGSHRRDLSWTPETPYSTRYFVLSYEDSGTLLSADMGHIAAVTEEDASTYLAIALRHGEGFGYSGSYKYYVAQTEDGTYMAIFLECQQELRSLRIFALTTLLVMAVCMLLIFVLVLFFSKRAIDPLIKNAQRQKRFITDASHELKTPLTVMTTSLKVLEMEVGQQKWIDKAQAQADKMRDLINELVQLSRMDEGSPATHLAEFDLSEAVSEIAEGFQDYAAAQGHVLDVRIPAGCTFHGDEYAIRQLVSILLDNAVKYTDKDGRIFLSLEQLKKRVVLRTRNPCAGLDPEKLEDLFERFYRPDSSRSKQTGGFGVGLSMARGITEMHNGSIRAVCPEPGIVEFVATLRA